MVPLLGLIVAATIPIQATQPVDLIARHEDHLGRIYTFRAVLTARMSRDDGRSWEPLSETTVVRRGAEERSHETIHGSLLAGRWRDDHRDRDVSYSASEKRLMDGYDPARPPSLPLTGSEEPEIKGAIFVPEPVGPAGRKSAWARALLFLPDGAYSLRELYEGSRSREVRPGRDERGRDTWEFHLDSRGRQYRHVVSICPEHGYAISENRTRYVGDPASGLEPYELVESVVEFRRAGDVWVPALIRGVGRFEETLTSELLVSEVEVNRPVADADVAMEFPAGTIVTDAAGNAFHLWGEAGPARTFQDRAELVAFVRERERAAWRARRRSRDWGLPVAALAAATVALVGLLALRWRLTRMRAA